MTGGLILIVVLLSIGAIIIWAVTYRNWKEQEYNAYLDKLKVESTQVEELNHLRELEDDKSSERKDELLGMKTKSENEVNSQNCYCQSTKPESDSNIHDWDIAQTHQQNFQDEIGEIDMNAEAQINQLRGKYEALSSNKARAQFVAQYKMILEKQNLGSNEKFIDFLGECLDKYNTKIRADYNIES